MRPGIGRLEIGFLLVLVPCCRVCGVLFCLGLLDVGMLW